jgi:hypothetical protein
VNNTIASNDSTAASGVLFQSLFAPLASAPGQNCTQNSGTQSCPRVAGLVSVTNSAILSSSLPTTGFSCPLGQATSGQCRYFSAPLMTSNVIWQNRSFDIGVGGFGPANQNQNQQKVVTLLNAFTGTAVASQPQMDGTTNDGSGSIVTGGTGACDLTNSQYWEVGVRGDTGPANHSVYPMTSTVLKLNPQWSVLTDAADYTGANNSALHPQFISQYCNGSRVPPENGSMGYAVNPGTNETNAVPFPVFNLTPSATVDEGNNWVNVRWGPVSMNHPVTGTTLGNYALASGSPVIDLIPCSVARPAADFYGNARPETGETCSNTSGHFDPGAVEFQPPAFPVLTLTSSPYNYGSVVVGTTATNTFTLTNSGGVGATGIAVSVTSTTAGIFVRPGTGGGTCTGTTLAAGASCTIIVTFTPASAIAYTNGGTITVTATTPASVGGSPDLLSGTGVAAIRTATVSTTPATSPTTLNFGNQARGVASPPLTITVTNTGNVALAGGTFTFGGGTPQPFSHPTQTGACGATLAVGANCTYNVIFTPPSTGPGSTNGFAFSRTLAVAYTGATVTGTPVTLIGMTETPAGTLTFSSATGGTVSTILGVRTLTFNTPLPDTAVVTITNTGTGPLQIKAETVASVPASANSLGTTTCSFTTPLAAGGTCTITVSAASAGLGSLTVANNGTGTTGGNSTLALVP